MKKTEKTFVLIDGNAILHRAWHALPQDLMTKDGTIINAAYGFTSILLKVLNDLKPDYIAVAWDTAAKTLREEKYEAYKAQRETKEQELYDQIPIIQEILDAFEIPNVYKDGYEADDIIGTLAKKSEKNGLQTIIVTGDIDLLQLVNENTLVYALKRGISDTILYDRAAIYERFGLTPEQIIDFKALKGDSSDNIKGVKGIGEKSATQLLQKFESVEGIYAALEDEKQQNEFKPAQRKNFEQGSEDAKLSKELTTIDCAVPVDFSVDDARFGSFSSQEVFNAFQQYEFKSLLNRVPVSEREEKLPKEDSTKDEKTTYAHIKTTEECEHLVKKLKKVKAFAFDTETTGFRSLRDDMLGLSIAVKKGDSYYIEADAVTDGLKKVFADPSIEKIAHHAKFDIEVVGQAGFEVNNLTFDTKIAAYLTNPGIATTGLKDLVFEEFGDRMTNLGDLLGKGKNALSMEELAEQKPDELAQYGAADSDYTLQLVSILKKRLENDNLLSVFEDIELPLIHVLVEMERNGILLDKKKLEKTAKLFEGRIEKIETEIYDLAKGEFNISSPKQLAEVLFERLELPTDNIKKTKTGYSTAASELEKLEPHHPIVSLIGRYRELTKLKNTYIDALPQLVNPETGRLHSTFHQTVTATGRLSSSDPNLQNIPIRSEEGRNIRAAFVAEKGKYLLACDYSQFELRIAASLAGDKEMIDAFKKGEDIHQRTAALINEIEPEKVTKKMRYAAKAVNFGIMYGQGPWGLSQTAKIPLDEAKHFINKYFEKHHAIADYIEQSKKRAKKNGYAETMFGRKRYIPEINSSVPTVRAQAERIAVNMPIQGSQADILKIAMIELHDKLAKRYEKDEVKMLLTVHDELVFEVKQELVEEVANYIVKTMEHPPNVSLDVPMKVDAEFGKHWGDLESLNQ